MAQAICSRIAVCSQDSSTSETHPMAERRSLGPRGSPPCPAWEPPPSRRLGQGRVTHGQPHLEIDLVPWMSFEHAQGSQVGLAGKHLSYLEDQVGRREGLGQEVDIGKQHAVVHDGALGVPRHVQDLQVGQSISKR